MNMEDYVIGQSGEYIDDLRYDIYSRSTGWRENVTQLSRTRISPKVCNAIADALGWTPLYNKQFVCVAKREGYDETQMVFIYHHDFNDYLVVFNIEKKG